jgi:hypothetical protein
MAGEAAMAGEADGAGEPFLARGVGIPELSGSVSGGPSSFDGRRSTDR